MKWTETERGGPPITRNNYHLQWTLYKTVGNGWKVNLYGLWNPFQSDSDSKSTFLYKLLSKLSPGVKRFGQVHQPVHPGLEFPSRDLYSNAFCIATHFLSHWKKEKSPENMGGGSQRNLGAKWFVHTSRVCCAWAVTTKEILVISFPCSGLSALR